MSLISFRVSCIVFFVPFLLSNSNLKGTLISPLGYSNSKPFSAENSHVEVDTSKPECYTSISALIGCLVKEYPELIKAAYIDTGKTEMDVTTIIISGSIEHLAIQRYYWELEQSEYQFYNISVDEFMKLISRITLGGIGYEYRVMKNSATSDKINWYQWENQYDDWVRGVILEECWPKGTRITIVGGI